MKRNELLTFTKFEIDFIIENANFTEKQLIIFNELCKNSLDDVGIMRIAQVTSSEYYNRKNKLSFKKGLKEQVLDKVCKTISKMK